MSHDDLLLTMLVGTLVATCVICRLFILLQ